MTMQQPTGGEMGSEAIGSEQVTVRGVVRAVIAQLEPDEVTALDGLLRHDDEQVRRWLGGRRRGGGPVGFGLHDVVLVLTPVVWMVVEEAIHEVVGKGVDKGAKGIGAVFRRVFRRRRANASTPPALPPLDEDQLSRVRAIVAQSAKRRGVPQRRATEIADLVAMQLGRGDGRRE
ncbi:hypothetical protein ACH4E7_25750 [Kitasatospora sp. NPDC018058]|uniref:hypothetical protein n=1 Tax=Kitasatospora sp. NPDC018058 TaxID=3364025 RepID=UPI0037BE542E